MPPSATDNAAESEPIPELPLPNPGCPLGAKGKGLLVEGWQIPPLVLERMRRVKPDMARHYKQRAGE